MVLTDSKKSADIKRILSGLILDEAKLERVREVFRREIELGLQFGLEKVTSCHLSGRQESVNWSML